MDEKPVKTKVIKIKDMHIESLKIKGFRPNPLLIKDLTLKNVRLILKLPSGK
ncbi:MAG: hypothetical protein PHD41_07190 [Methanosarcinaceae archaeon]|nr:hypothetical protein [Methanosarcinaceae archaeon]MDD4330981.1 hypothetical protein [Methanosarcinaceae archaeon]